MWLASALFLRNNWENRNRWARLHLSRFRFLSEPPFLVPQNRVWSWRRRLLPRAAPLLQQPNCSLFSAKVALAKPLPLFSRLRYLFHLQLQLRMQIRVTFPTVKYVFFFYYLNVLRKRKKIGLLYMCKSEVFIAEQERKKCLSKKLASLRLKIAIGLIAMWMCLCAFYLWKFLSELKIEKKKEPKKKNKDE